MKYSITIIIILLFSLRIHALDYCATCGPYGFSINGVTGRMTYTINLNGQNQCNGRYNYPLMEITGIPANDIYEFGYNVRAIGSNSLFPHATLTKPGSAGGEYLNNTISGIEIYFILRTRTYNPSTNTHTPWSSYSEVGTPIPLTDCSNPCVYNFISKNFNSATDDCSTFENQTYTVLGLPANCQPPKTFQIFYQEGQPQESIFVTTDKGNYFSQGSSNTILLLQYDIQKLKSWGNGTYHNTIKIQKDSNRYKILNVYVTVNLENDNFTLEDAKSIRECQGKEWDNQIVKMKPTADNYNSCFYDPDDQYDGFSIGTPTYTSSITPAPTGWASASFTQRGKSAHVGLQFIDEELLPPGTYTVSYPVLRDGQPFDTVVVSAEVLDPQINRECSDCSDCQDCADGVSTSAELGSFNYSINLNEGLKPGQSVTINYNEEEQPKSLRDLLNSVYVDGNFVPYEVPVQIWHPAPNHNLIKQVKTAGQLLHVDILSNKLQISAYDTANVGSLVNGVYQIINPSLKKYYAEIMINPALPADSQKKSSIVVNESLYFQDNVEKTKSYKYDYKYLSPNHVFSLGTYNQHDTTGGYIYESYYYTTESDPVRKIKKFTRGEDSSSTDYSKNTIYIDRDDPNTQAIDSNGVVDTWELELPYQEIENPDDAVYKRVTEYDYKKVTANGHSRYYVSGIKHPDGTWVKYDYNFVPNLGYVVNTKTITPYNNSLYTNETESAHNVTTYTYTKGTGNFDVNSTPANSGDDILCNWVQEQQVNSVLGVAKSTITKKAYRPQTPASEPMEYVITTTSFGTQSSVLRQDYKNYNTIGRKLVYESDHEAIGLVASYTYDAQTKETQETMERGKIVSGAVAKGTRTERTTNEDGIITIESIYDIESDLLIYQKEADSFDDSGRVLTWSFFEGTNETYEETQDYDCCGLSSETDRYGTTTTFGEGYETLFGKRLRYERVSRLLPTGGTLVMRECFDTSDNLIETKRNGIKIEGHGYNLAGEVTSDSLPSPTTTSSGYYIQRSYTKTYTSGAALPWSESETLEGTTTERKYQLDGRLGEISGNAVVGQKIEYRQEASLPAGTEAYATHGPYEVTKTTHPQSLTGVTNSLWSEVWQDALGRVVLERKSWDAAGGSALTGYTYEGLSHRVSKVVSPTGVTTIYKYNDLKEISEVLTVTYNDPTGTDPLKKYRRTTFHTTYESRTVEKPGEGQVSLNVRVSKERTYTKDGTNNYDERVTAESVGGTYLEQTANGLTTRVGRKASATDGVSTETTVFPDNSTLVVESKHGYVVSRSHTAESGTLLYEETIAYDSDGRPSSTTNAEGLTNTITYVFSDAVDRVTLPESAPGAYDSRKIDFQHDGLGRVTLRYLLTNLNTSIVKNEQSYNTRGQALRSWGDAGDDFPSERAYDGLGRLTDVYTWRTFSLGSPTSSTTSNANTRAQWTYDPHNGLLATKNQETISLPTSYTWRKDGSLQNITNSRSQTNTYAYYLQGQLDTITYKDNAGADIVSSFGYDRAGRVDYIEDASGERSLSYNNNRLDEECYDGGLLSGWKITRSYDKGRLAGISLVKPDQTVVQIADYAYTDENGDDESRLTVASLGDTHFLYSYKPNTAYISNISAQVGEGAPFLTLSQQWDQLGRLKAHQYSNGPQANYRYNNKDQREYQHDENGNYWHFKYDPLQQVNEAKAYQQAGANPAPTSDAQLPGWAFTYTQDSIGNRTSASSGLQGGLSSTYTRTTSANLYSQRTVPGTVTVIGEAHEDATITGNGIAATRLDEYFAINVPVTNSVEPKTNYVKVEAILEDAEPDGSDAVARQFWNTYVAQTPEVFTYDPDKNLQKDGRWEYSWNSLNQLEKMSLIPTATGTGKARHQVWTFVYDAQGRRVAKRFYEKFGADFAAGDFPEDYYLLEETLFFYDGWNLIAEVNAFTGDMKTYLWGTDLSGTFQGAGGVGGLLAITDWKTNKTYAVLNDGRGNVTGLVDVSSGEQVAKYAYGPFGESVMAVGEAREVCPFRFSTKYFDKATGLHYYGYRYYSASMGRWLNRDPIGEAGGVNVYGFVGNDPVNKWDYLGMWTVEGISKLLCSTPEGQKILRNISKDSPSVFSFTDWMLQKTRYNSSTGVAIEREPPVLASTVGLKPRGTEFNDAIYINAALPDTLAVVVLRDEYNHIKNPKLASNNEKYKNNFKQYEIDSLEHEINNTYESQLFASDYNSLNPGMPQLPIEYAYYKNGVLSKDLIRREKSKIPVYSPVKINNSVKEFYGSVGPSGARKASGFEFCCETIMLDIIRINSN